MPTKRCYAMTPPLVFGWDHQVRIDLTGFAQVDRRAKSPVEAPWLGSRRTATRAIPGAISLSSSGYFAYRLYSLAMNPVAFPPGRAKVSTYPAPTGSVTTVNTIGMLRVDLENAAAVDTDLAGRPPQGSYRSLPDHRPLQTRAARWLLERAWRTAPTIWSRLLTKKRSAPT